MAPIPLDKQEDYEALWFARSRSFGFGHSPHPNGPLPDRWMILFTSMGCAPCARLDKSAIEEAATAAGYTFFICDAKINSYTPVFCDVSRFPTFQLMKPGNVIASLTSSDTATVVDWILKHKVGTPT